MTLVHEVVAVHENTEKTPGLKYGVDYRIDTRT